MLVFLVLLFNVHGTAGGNTLKGKWIMNAWSVTSFPVECCLFGQQFLAHLDTQRIAQTVLGWGWIEPQFIHQARDNAVYEEKIRDKSITGDFRKILGTMHVACHELFDCRRFIGHHSSRYLSMSELELHGTEFPEVDHLIVVEPAMIGAQACATPDPMQAGGDEGSRMMEFFGKRFLVKNITCFPLRQKHPDYYPELLSAIGDQDGVVALAAMGGWMHPTEVGWDNGHGLEYYSQLKQFKPASSVAMMVKEMQDRIGEPYIAVHWRRGDRAHPEMGSYGLEYWELSRPFNVACILNRMLAKTGLDAVFVATNSGTPREREQLRQSVRGRVFFLADVFESDWTEELHAMAVEIFLCSQSRMFLSAGKSFHLSSTISRIIYRFIHIMSHDDDRSVIVVFLFKCDGESGEQARVSAHSNASSHAASAVQHSANDTKHWGSSSNTSCDSVRSSAPSSSSSSSSLDAPTVWASVLHDACWDDLRDEETLPPLFAADAVFTVSLHHFLTPWFSLFGCETPGLALDEHGVMVLPRGIRRLKIDVGLAFNAPNSQLWLRKIPDLAVMAFEPNRRAVADLLSGRNRARGPNYVYLDRAHIGQRFFLFPVALGAEPGMADFHATPQDPGTSSFFEPDGSYAQMAGFERYSVPVATLAQVLAVVPWGSEDEAGKVAVLEHVKIDAQGADLHILQGAGPLLRDKVVCVTAEKQAPGYKGGHSPNQLLLFMLDQGFRLLDEQGGDYTFVNRYLESDWFAPGDVDCSSQGL